MALGLKAITSRLGYQQITSLSSATSLTVPTVDKQGLACKPSIAIIVAETQAVRWLDDDSTLSSTRGMPLATGVAFVYDGDLTKIKFIEQTAGAVLNVSYYS
jgi:hypothetical protein